MNDRKLPVKDEELDKVAGGVIGPQPPKNTPPHLNSGGTGHRPPEPTPPVITPLD